jgi:DNA-binding protein HU-beta
MTKAELVTRIAEERKTSKREAEAWVAAIFTELGKAITADGRFAYPAFGTFRVRKRAARKGRHPRTGKVLKIKASKTVTFAPAPRLKQEL